MKDKIRISIDPGVEFGWAFWREESWAKLSQPMAAGVISFTAKAPWDERIVNGIGRLKSMALGFNVQAIYVEYPQVFASAGGNMVAKKGDLGKLYFFCGVLAGVYAKKKARVELIPVNEWKGQLSKDIVNKRIQKKLNVKEFEYKSHAWDAVGIGLYAKGFF